MSKVFFDVGVSLELIRDIAGLTCLLQPLCPQEQGASEPLQLGRAVHTAAVVFPPSSLARAPGNGLQCLLGSFKAH